MFKKVIPIVISLCLIFSISVMAENTSAVTDGSAAGSPQQMSQGERTQGGRGNMGTPQSGAMQGRIPPNMPNGEMPQGEFTPPKGFTPPQNAGEFAPTESRKNNAEAVTPPANENVTTENQQTQENGTESNQTPGRNQQFGGMGGFPGNMQSNSGQTQEAEPMTFGSFVKTYSTPITSVILLALAFIFVIFYRRKNY